MKDYLAYMDESGDPVFADKASRTFFVGAVVIKKQSLPQLSAAVAAIRDAFQIHELKSSQIGSHDRRVRICEKLAATGLRIATITVQKDALRGEWFARKQTFYKYIQGMLNHELYRVFGTVNVTIDRYGSPAYQQSFARYLERKLQRELFDPQIELGSAKDNDFIQTSDFLIGSIRKATEGSLPDGDSLLEMLRPVWPVRLKVPDEGHHVKAIPSTYSKAELQACMDEAWRYLETNSRRADDPKILTLEYLYYTAIDGRNDWVFTDEIQGWLRGLGHSLSDEQFRNDVTAALRDEGLVIVSSRKGLKIPWTAEDFREYILFSVNLALPVLKRLKKAMQFVSEKTPLDDVQSLLSDEMRRVLNQVDA